MKLERRLMRILVKYKFRFSCRRNSRYKRRRTPRYRTSPVILPFASSSSQLSYESSRMILLDEERRKASKHSRHTNGVIGNKGPFQIQSSDLDPGTRVGLHGLVSDPLYSLQVADKLDNKINHNQ